MIDDILKEARERMEKTIESLQYDLTGIRTGRASPALVERLKVEYYGALTPLNQMASIAIPEPRLIAIRPWDPSALSAIEKAILKSDLGLTPVSDGRIIRLAIPPLTEERREELVRLMSRRLEEARVAVRNIRRESIESLREFESEKLISEDEMYKGKDQIQEVTDKMIARIDEIGKQKEADIRTV